MTHRFSGKEVDDRIEIDGSFDVNLWYSYDNDTKTSVITKNIPYKEMVTVAQKETTDSSSKDIIVRSLKQPSCISAKEKDNTIVIDIEKELGVEIVGDTKVKIAIEEDEEPWDEIPEDVTDDTMKEIDDEPYTYNAAAYIKSLYNSSTKTTVINNSINYEYDTTNSLMKDVGGNIRYYGASPNNYIYFNCSDYSNQSSSTCETWRIIGTFGNKTKLIRNSSIGEYSWDNKDTSTGAKSAYGKNDWTDARLMKLLNQGYESETTGGSLYYNSGSGNCYSGQNNATTACDFTSTGIKNDTTRNMISDNTYSLLGWNNNSIYSNQIYEYERSTGSVYTGTPTSWTGKVGLAYVSDYGYAADLSKCTKQLGSYNDSTCASNNWMKAIITNNSTNASGWLLTHYYGDSCDTWRTYWAGNAGYSGAYYAFEVTPVLYLKYRISINSGTGTSSDPYQIST